MEFVLTLLLMSGAYIGWRHKKNARFNFFVDEASRKMNLTKEQVIEDFCSICCDVKTRCKQKGIYLWGIKPWHLKGKKEKLNANAGLLWPPIISYTPSWISKVISEDPQWRIAFLHTMGHEIGHRDHEPKPRFSLAKTPSAKTLFVNYVRECRCDFYGMEFMRIEYPQYTREDIILAKEKEANEIAKFADNTKGTNSTHPNWSFRLDLLKTYNCFDKTVVERIATETHFTNQQYIDELIAKALFEY